MTVGCLLCLPRIQDILVNNIMLVLSTISSDDIFFPDFWRNILFDSSIILFCCCCMILITILCETKMYQKWYSPKKDKVDLYFCIFASIFFLCLFVLPFILFGENSVVTIHDNLDDSVPRFSYIHKHQLLWKFDETIPVMNGISTVFFNREGYSLYNFIYCLFPTYMGYVVNYAVCVLLGFFSMFYLQKTLFKNGNTIILVLTSWAYALLPSICSYKMALASLPLAALFFYKLATKKEKKWLALSFIFPFFSELSGVGIFICCSWLLASIIASVKKRKVNVYLFAAWLLLIFGYCLVNFHLIYIRFVLAEPLNRDFFTIPPEPFFSSFVTFFFSGYYHAPTLQNRLVIWLVLGVFSCSLFKTFRKHDEAYFVKDKVLLISVVLCFFCALIAALSESLIIEKIFKVVCPPLAGVSFTRFYTLERLFWYIAFTASLFFLARNVKYKGLAYTLALLQIMLIFMGVPLPSKSHYYDSKPTWSKNIGSGNDISWNEFFSETLFKRIKNDLNYNGEKVVAFGFHPGVLLYNNFNTIDGYISFYPYREQVLWHELMLPEFEQDVFSMNYFDSWGGRRYIYNKDLSYQPTRKKRNDSVDLLINLKMLKNVYKCKYILSRIKIKNEKDLPIKLSKSYKGDDFYDIWVYLVE